MKTDESLERELRSILRETLDGELGPDPAWRDSPAALRIAERDRRDRRRWPLRVLAVAALIGAGGGAALLGGRLAPIPEVAIDAANGWIAFTVAQSDSGGEVGDTDIWLVAFDRDARRVIGTDTDDINQLCAAFAPDGRSLAYGRVEGHGTNYSPAGMERPATYRNAALMVADVSDDARVTDRLTVDVGDGLPPPCPVWSPNGEQVAFGVPRTSPVNPETSATGSEVWIVTLADRSIKVLPDLLATDLEWSPDGSLLAIASGDEARVSGNHLLDGRIHLYAHASDAMRSLAGTLGAGSLTWSPDGQRIAYTVYTEGDSVHDLRVIDVDTEREDVLATGVGAIHGIGPVWSPDGESIVYQRLLRNSGERHEVVLVMPGNISGETGLPTEVVVPTFHGNLGGPSGYLYPYRVTWSPDGEYLLYLAWSEGLAAASGLVAVPTDPDMPPIVLSRDVNFVPYDGYPDTSLVPIQTWGRQPSD